MPLSSPSEVHAAARGLARPLIIPLFCVTLFCSSVLLFLAEPMFAKMVLPLLGGTPAVWNTCMVCFQAFLFGAYAYGHWSTQYFGVRRQVLVQLAVLIAVAAALPIGIPAGWRPPAGRSPIFWLLTVLPVGVGLPFFAIASTAPVLQRWFAASAHRGRGDPYFLYAASNLGSIVALLAYPALLEPLTRLAGQTRLWTAGYLGLIALVGCCGFFVEPQQRAARVVRAEKIAGRRRARWVVLAMIPSSLLLGATTFITTDIAAVPLLWIVPLTIYLLSFILVFSSRPLVPHRLMVRLLPVTALGVALFMLGRVAQPVWMVLSLHLAALFVASMVCHGELATDRPSSGRLTDFYLMMSLGGVLGGLFNALLAPLIFHSAAEYPIALIAACAACPAVAFPGTHRWRDRLLDVLVPILVAALVLGIPRALAACGHDSITLRMLGTGIPLLVAVGTVRRRARFLAALATLFLLVPVGPANSQLLAVRRSFFGIHRVAVNPDGPFHDLYHGTTVHGRQRIDPATGMPCQPTNALTYYHRTGPIGQLMLQRTSAGRAKRVAVVGLGVGSLAAYADRGMRLDYFEIDPAVKWMAEDSEYFSFLKSARSRGAEVVVVTGDARLTLQDLPNRSCDLIVLDAFCGDAIPVHLLTREAMDIYLDKLADDGVLAIHISNIYLDLLPVCSALVSDADCAGLEQTDLSVSPGQAAEGKSASQWVLVARTEKTLFPQCADRRWVKLPAPTAPVWTDGFADVLGVFRWHS